MKNHWYLLNKKSLFWHLKIRNSGLSEEEAELRLKKCGPNKLPEAKAESVFLIFLRQFQSPLIYILLGASLLVFLTKEFVDGAAIFFVLLFNAVVGLIFAGIFPALKPFFLSFAAGAMIFIALHELYPMARIYKKIPLFILGILISSIVYIILATLITN